MSTVMASARAADTASAGAAAVSIPISEHYLPLPVSQLRLCVKIWNSDAATAAPAATADSPSPDQHAFSAAAAQTQPLPRVRAHDTHLIAIHGWLDNAASWDRMCPTMIATYAASPLAARLTAEARAAAAATAAASSTAAAASAAASVSPSRLVCYCIEMSGHGDSDHRSAGATYYPTEHALDMQQAVTLLGLEPAEPGATHPSPLLFVMGHSMGAAVSAILASLLGDRCAGLVMMDGTGPWAPATMLPNQPEPGVSKLSLALSEHASRGSTTKRLPKVYPLRKDIVDKYVKGNPFMEERSARILARRAVRPVWFRDAPVAAAAVPGSRSASRQVDLGVHRPPGAGWQEGWCFKHDNRLSSSALMQPLEPNTLTSFSQVQCPVLMFLATNQLRRALYAQGKRDPRVPTHWLLPETNPSFEGVVARRVASFPRGCKVVRVEGDHHIHMDAPAEALARDVVEFLQRTVLEAPASARAPTPPLLALQQGGARSKL